jgi:hypothetical protein
MQLLGLVWCTVAQIAGPEPGSVGEYSVVAAAAVIVAKIGGEAILKTKNWVQRKNGKPAIPPGMAARCIEHIETLADLKARMRVMEKRLERLSSGTNLQSGP